MKDRLIAYVDGFNLYRGMRAANMRALLWLDLYKLAQSLCPKHAHVDAVKYFTARILNLKDRTDPNHAAAEASRKRQSEYIEALASRGVQVFEGKFKRRTIECRTCKSTWDKPEEKASDVQLATQLLCDAFRARLDTVMIVSGDADIVPAAHVVADELRLKVIVAFPPKRILNELKKTGPHWGWIHIRPEHIAKSQLPDRFTHEGHTFKRPTRWTGRIQA